MKLGNTSFCCRKNEIIFSTTKSCLSQFLLKTMNKPEINSGYYHDKILKIKKLKIYAKELNNCVCFMVNPFVCIYFELSTDEITFHHFTNLSLFFQRRCEEITFT